MVKWAMGLTLGFLATVGAAAYAGVSMGSKDWLLLLIAGVLIVTLGPVIYVGVGNSSRVKTRARRAFWVTAPLGLVVTVVALAVGNASLVASLLLMALLLGTAGVGLMAMRKKDAILSR